MLYKTPEGGIHLPTVESERRYGAMSGGSSLLMNNLSVCPFDR